MTDRTPTALDAIADDHVARLLPLAPSVATDLGAPGYDHLLEDYSPDGVAALDELNQATLRAVAAAEPEDAVDEVTKAAMIERLQLEVEMSEAGEPFADLNNINSPLQMIREVFDLMPTGSVEDWEVIAARLRAVDGATTSYLEGLRAATGPRPAARQFELGIAEAALQGGPDSFWTAFASGAQAGDEELPDTLRADLARAADDARAAYARLAEGLRGIAAGASAQDAVGRERYERFSRRFLGARIDLDETYEWGQEELARIVAEQELVAGRIGGPGTSVEGAIAILNADPTRRLHGTDALRSWMQATSDAAVEALAGTQFDIPDPVRTLECRIAPTATGGIYYTGPNDDFSRPGAMWWSVPQGVDTFTTWQEKTTVYHEGVPGHHLQIGQTVYRAQLLNSWRRHVCWVSGHGEGWALYAERLMRELGFLDDPGDYLGMLDGQRLRAARVVLDIGVHLDLEHPDGGRWSYARAWEFLRANSGEADQFLRFELHRYLGWPGQAPSYKVGQRLWEDIRDRVARREGAAFDLRAFHRRALDVGSVGLDVLRDALLT
ncbi:MAG: DUF885 domain-containing protein [Propionibacterium sp.]|nr:DUF885 domain-containing protein [Propionibacterium sp.]